jgi:hypothetical protein
MARDTGNVAHLNRMYADAHAKIPGMKDEEVKAAIEDTLACMNEPMSDDMQAREEAFLDALVVEARSRGLDVEPLI